MEILRQERTDDEEGRVVKGEHGVDRGHAGAEVPDAGKQIDEGKAGSRESSRNEDEPEGTKAKDSECDQGEDERDAHLVDEGPEGSVELRPVVVAEEENVLDYKRRADGLGPGAVDPEVVGVEGWKVAVAEDGEG